MGIRLVRVETMSLTPAVLERLLSLSRVPGERDLEMQRLRFIRALLRNRLYNRCEWAQCLCRENGILYRVNGQHTGHSLQEIRIGQLDAPFPEGIPVTWQCWECDEVRELGDVFDQFDHHRSTRKPKDRLGIYLAQYGELVGKVSKDYTSAILAGVTQAARTLPACAEAVPEDFVPSEAYERGMLLAVQSVRDFILLTAEHYADAVFTQWAQKTGIVAKFFDCFLTCSRDDFELLFEQTVYEVGELPRGFADKIRREFQKKGKGPEDFVRLTEKYILQLKKATEVLDAAKREEIKRLIREVREEDDGEASAA